MSKIIILIIIINYWKLFDNWNKAEIKYKYYMLNKNDKHWIINF